MAKSNPITSHFIRSGLVGEFFVALAHRYIGGIRNGHINGHGLDLKHYRHGALLEVKGISSSMHISFKVSQLEDYLGWRDSVFPFAWLIVFRYTTKQMRAVIHGKNTVRHVPLYKFCQTERRLKRHLCQSLATCHVIDLSVFDALRKHQPTTYDLRGNRKTEVIRISAGLLRSLTQNGWRERLARLGLDPHMFLTHEQDVVGKFEGEPIRFRFDTLTQRKPRSFKPLPVLFGYERKGVLHL